MKHILFSIMIGLAFIGILAAQSEQVEMGIIKGDRLNIRARPLGTAEICGQLHKGDHVEILERRLVQIAESTNTEEWIRITLPETCNVWVQSSYLDKDHKAASKINGRAGPSLMWPVLGLFAKGDILQVRTNELDWVAVAPPRNASAWVAGRFVTSQMMDIPTAPVKQETP